MPFDVELAFTGLGLVLLRSRGQGKRDPNPCGVDLLLLRTDSPECSTAASAMKSSLRTSDHHLADVHEEHSSGNHDHVPHLPRLWFSLDDLALPEKLFPDIPVGTNGMPIVEFDVEGMKLEIFAEGGVPDRFEIPWAEDPEAVGPGPGAPHNALDWIPDISKHFGLDPVILPESDSKGEVYSTCVKLPPGNVFSQHLLLNHDLSPAKWLFEGQQQEQGRVLAERVIWSRRGVTSLQISFRGGSIFHYDAAIRKARGEREVVSLALTNLPQQGPSGRFRDPTHFEMFEKIKGEGSSSIRKVKRLRARDWDITSGGACPPVVKEI